VKPRESTFSASISEMYMEVLRNGGDQIKRIPVVGHAYNEWGRDCPFGQAIALVPEPENKFDPNAIAVWSERDGVPVKVGHIGREHTATVIAMGDGDLLAHGSSPLSVYIIPYED
jgi:hypothetical protein